MADTISVPVFEAKNRLSALLAEVAKGAEIVITNRGVPVARIIPPTRRPRSASARSGRWRGSSA